MKLRELTSLKIAKTPAEKAADYVQAEKSNGEFTDKQIKMAYGVLNDPRYHQGNYSGAVDVINKIAPGLADHPSVKKALMRANEDSDPSQGMNKYQLAAVKDSEGKFYSIQGDKMTGGPFDTIEELKAHQEELLNGGDGQAKEELTPQEKNNKMSDYDAKKKALQDIQSDPNTNKDPELKKELMRRKAELEKTKESVDSETDAIIGLAKLVAGASDGQQKQYSDFANEMRALAGIKEDATAGATSAGNIASVANPAQAYGQRGRDANGVPKAPQKKKADGTAKNALDISNNLMGGKTVKR